MFIAQTDSSGIVHTVAEISDGVMPPNSVALPSLDASKLGQKWDGAAFVAAPVDAAADALAELAKIDRETGMSRLLRETLVAIAGPTKTPAKLADAESRAAVQRARLL